MPRILKSLKEATQTTLAYCENCGTLLEAERRELEWEWADNEVCEFASCFCPECGEVVRFAWVPYTLPTTPNSAAVKKYFHFPPCK